MAGILSTAGWAWSGGGGAGASAVPAAWPEVPPPLVPSVSEDPFAADPAEEDAPGEDDAE